MRMKMNERRDLRIPQGKHNTNMVFNFFPKGWVPPSGPSKRHNEVVDSTPQN